MANDERQASTATPQIENLFELVVESATDFAIYTIDPRGIVSSWNVGAERLFGYSEDEILGRDGDVIFTPEDRARGVAQMERATASAAGRAENERWHQRRDGSRFWASGLLMRLKGPTEGFVKIARDRTEQHQAADRLRENEERFRLLATSIPQLVFRTRVTGDRTWGSPQWVAFTGLSLEASVGQGWLDAVHPDDVELTRAAWTQARATGDYYVEHRIRRAGRGDYRWHQTRARPINSANGVNSDWVGTMTDIDDLRSLNDRQQVMMAELQHRTRNLLAVVQSIANQTLRTSPDVERFGEEFAGRLAALSRVQGILAGANHRDVDLRDLVLAELEAHADGAMATDKIVVDGPRVLLPATSAQSLSLALHELTTNAVKYGALAQADARLEVRWTREEQPDKPVIRLEWRESGVTMPSSGTDRRKGYGTELIERALPYQLRARTRLEFGETGVSCTIEVPDRRAVEPNPNG